MRNIDWKKYLFVLAVTSAIFFTALYVSNSFSEKRIAEIRSIEENISIDILSLETQFELLQELSCEDIEENSILTKELNSLARKLSYTEVQLGQENAEVLKLKRSYSLLQIKDYLLMKKVSEKCDLEPVFILYFYSNLGNCDDCTKEGHVLTKLSEENPKLRVYAFDYNLDLSALRTLVSINEIENRLPSLVIDDEVYYGYQSMEDIQEILPALKPEETATSTEEIVDQE